MSGRWPFVVLLILVACAPTFAQATRQPDWRVIEPETLQHFQSLLRLDTTNPPGNERLVTDYLKGVFEKEGISVQVFAQDPNRPSLVARLKGNGSKRPLLLMGHTDEVTVDPKKWTFPPFSATRNEGYVYGRGSLDDRPHVVAGLMTLLMLKRLNVALDRDVVFLAEPGEESGGSVGVDFMANEHLPEINAEYCLAEGGNVTRVGGRALYASVQTMEKIPRPVDLTVKGTSGHGSRPLRDNAVVQLATAVGKIGSFYAPVRFNETTRVFFQRLSTIASPQDAARFKNILTPASAEGKAADDYFQLNEPAYASMLRTSISATMINAGYRFNVIPSDAKATLDVRMLPDEKPEEFLQTIRKVINNPTIEVTWSTALNPRQGVTTTARIDNEAFKAIEASAKKHYEAIAVPEMGTGATDMAQLRAKGILCYGIGPAIDREDLAKGFGAHTDQERIIESELYRFVQYQWDIVNDLARTK
jgi:acetylornithine deacetylase/succinyl-diaminopimelate desuccinylase-like protein